MSINTKLEVENESTFILHGCKRSNALIYCNLGSFSEFLARPVLKVAGLEPTGV